MQPTPYVLPAAANYQVLAGNHVPPVVDANGMTYWALNVKKGGNPLLYFAVFLQPPTGEAREVLAFSRVAEGKEVGQGGLFFVGQELWASAFRSPTDAVSPPFVGRVPEYKAFPVPPDANATLTILIQQLGKPETNIAQAIGAAALRAISAAALAALAKK